LVLVLFGYAAAPLTLPGSQERIQVVRSNEVVSTENHESWRDGTPAIDLESYAYTERRSFFLSFILSWEVLIFKSLALIVFLSFFLWWRIIENPT